MTEEEFAQLTADYVAAAKARLKMIRVDITTRPGAAATYRELADTEWQLGQAWDAEIRRISES